MKIDNLFDDRDKRPTDSPSRDYGEQSRTEWNNDPKDSKDDYETPGGLD